VSPPNYFVCPSRNFVSPTQYLVPPSRTFARSLGTFASPVREMSRSFQALVRVSRTLLVQIRVLVSRTQLLSAIARRNAATVSDTHALASVAVSCRRPLQFFTPCFITAFV